jgi:predicted metal-dependent phosphotriesterase family hydrolase
VTSVNNQYTVQSVSGPLTAGQLGITQCHEHVSIDISHVNNDETYRLDDLAIVGEDLRDAARAGLRTIVDVGTDGHRRSAAFLASAAEYSGLQIIAATGFWKEIVYPEYFDNSSIDEIADSLVRDITVGIGGTQVRAGVIGELGTDAPGLTPRTEKAFRACASAQRQTGVALITHTGEGVAALDQLHLLLSCGVDPGRIVIGHVDCMDDVEMHSAIAAAGAFVGYDRVGSLRYQKDEVRIRLTTEMISRGYEKNVILSCDLATQRRMRCQGELGYSYLLESFVPRLRDAGVSEGALEQILVDNPRRLLTGAPG